MSNSLFNGIENTSQIYYTNLDKLTELVWLNSETYRQNSHIKQPPEWLKKVMRVQLDGMFFLANAVPNLWVVFPDYTFEYSMVLFKKQGDNEIHRLRRVQERFFENIESPKSANFAKVATTKFEHTTMPIGKRVIKLEDENILAFSFPSALTDKVIEILTKI